MTTIKRFFTSLKDTSVAFIGNLITHAKGLTLMAMSTVGAIAVLGRYTTPFMAIAGGVVSVAVLCA